MQDKLEAQVFVDALRRGEFASTAEVLAKKIYEKYQTPERPLLADDYLPLMTNILAETDISINDLPMLKVGTLSTGSLTEVGYYMNEILVAAAVFLSHEAWLREQEGNQDKSPEEIRQMVKDEVTKAFEKKEDGISKAVKITEGKLSKQMAALDLLTKEASHPKAFDYAINHLIKENNTLIRETGELLVKELNQVEAEMAELDKKIVSAEAKIKELGKDAKEHKDDLKKMVQSRRVLFDRKIELEEHLSNLMVKPHDFNANKAFEKMPNVKSIQELKGRIESYLEFLNDNPVEEPEENLKLLRSYESRKSAATMMLTAIKTASLRSPEQTLAILQDNAEALAKNRPGIWELGIIAWIKDYLSKSGMMKTTDEALKSTKAEIETLGTNSFFLIKQELNEIKKENEVVPEHNNPMSPQGGGGS
ncbi:hypothetical protein [Legionella sp. WA2022007384]